MYRLGEVAVPNGPVYSLLLVCFHACKRHMFVSHKDTVDNTKYSACLRAMSGSRPHLSYVECVYNRPRFHVCYPCEPVLV